MSCQQQHNDTALASTACGSAGAWSLSAAPQNVTKTSRKERLAAKFVEAEFEKVDRLMEITFRYGRLSWYMAANPAGWPQIQTAR